MASPCQIATAGVIASIVPGGLHQRTSQVPIARFGDTTLTAFVAAGVFGGDQTQAGHELPCVGKAAEVSDVSDEGQRDEGLDAFEDRYRQ